MVQTLGRRTRQGGSEAQGAEADDPGCAARSAGELRALPVHGRARRGRDSDWAFLLEVADRFEDHGDRGDDGKERGSDRTLARMEHPPFGKALFIEAPAILQHPWPLHTHWCNARDRVVTGHLKSTLNCF